MRYLKKISFSSKFNFKYNIYTTVKNSVIIISFNGTYAEPKLTLNYYIIQIYMYIKLTVQKRWLLWSFRAIVTEHARYVYLFRHANTYASSQNVYCALQNRVDARQFDITQLLTMTFRDHNQTPVCNFSGSHISANIYTLNLVQTYAFFIHCYYWYISHGKRKYDYQMTLWYEHCYVTPAP